MRTAEEIIKERYPFYNENIQQKDVELNGEQVTELINKARKEAIEELIVYMDNHSMKNTGTYKKAVTIINELK